jgi:hypothetical protein
MSLLARGFPEVEYTLAEEEKVVLRSTFAALKVRGGGGELGNWAVE